MVLCRDYQFSTRRACGLIGFSRSSNEYRGRPDRHARIRERLVTLSGKHRRYGYRMLHAKLGQEGFKVNVKVVERLYREERLTLRRRNRKKIPKGVREGAWCPIWLQTPPTSGGAWTSPWMRSPTAGSSAPSI